MDNKKINSNGFTLVELLVVAPIVMIVVIGLMSFLFNLYGQLTQQGVQLSLQVEAQSIVFSMQDDVFFASAFVNTKNENLIDSYAPSGGWNYSTTPQTLIISYPATTQNHRIATRQLVHINELGCTPPETLEENSLLYNNVIYFLEGSNLYKRILTAPSSLATCGTSYQRQSCPEANATSACPADRLLTSKVESFNIEYYNVDNTLVSVPEEASRIKVSLALKEKAYAEDVRSNISLTMKRLNQ